MARFEFNVQRILFILFLLNSFYFALFFLSCDACETHSCLDIPWNLAMRCYWTCCNWVVSVYLYLYLYIDISEIRI